MADIIIGTNYLGTTLGDTNNSVLVSTGDVITGNTEAGYAQLFQQYGFCSLPPNGDLDTQTAAECVVIKGVSNRDVIVSTRDATSQPVYANMSAGDVQLYSAGSDRTAQCRIKLSGDNQTIIMSVPDANGNQNQLQVNATGLSFFSAFGKLVFDATGFHVTTSSGASFHLGSLSTTSIPGVTPNNYCKLNSDLITISGGIVKLGLSEVYAAPVIAPPGVASLAPGTPAIAPVVVGVTGIGLTSTTVLIGA